MAKLTQPLKWHGGKHYLAKWIISHFPEHTHYVEPYFGGGSVMLQKPVEWIEGHSEVVNDINGELMCFWYAIQGTTLFAKFKRMVEAVPMSETSFTLAMNKVKSMAQSFGPERPPFTIDTVTRAAAFFIANRQSRQGLMKDFATMSRTRTRRGMNEQASSWLTAIEGLPEIHERLKRVVIFNKDAVQLIRSQDGTKTFFYLDPPYLHDTRVTKSDYQHEMRLSDHIDLLNCLSDIKGKFILSGYPSDCYSTGEKRNGWRREEKRIDNKASSKKTKETKTECIWMNY